MKFSKSPVRRLAAHRAKSGRGLPDVGIQAAALSSNVEPTGQSPIQREGATLFVGLGNMGYAVAKNIAPGREMFLFDNNVELSAAFAADTAATALPDLRSVPGHVRTVILMLPNSAAVEHVLEGPEGVLRQLKAGSLIVDMGFSDPASTQRLARDASELDIAYVDAPVLGTTSDADSGDLQILIGGSETPVGLAMAHLRYLGKDILHVGPVGTAHAVKSLVSLHIATSLAVSTEILCAAKFLGIQPASMCQILESAAGPRSLSATYFPAILSGDFNSRFRLEEMLGDLKTAEKTLDTWAVEAPIAHATFDTARAARKILQTSDPDSTEIVSYYERANGVLLRDTTAQHPTDGTGEIDSTQRLEIRNAK